MAAASGSSLKAPLLDASASVDPTFALSLGSLQVDGDAEAGDHAHGHAHGGEEEEGEGEASVLSSVFNLSNTILGGGTLAMAFACYESGIIFFLLMLGFFAYVANFTIRLLVICVENCPGVPLQYAALAKRTIGRNGELAAEWAVIVQQIGACCAYMVLIADVLQPIASLGASGPDSALCSRKMWQVLIAVLIIFPLCMLRRMDSLKYTSLVALACILALVLAVTIIGLRAEASSTLRDQWAHPVDTSNMCDAATAAATTTAAATAATQAAAAAAGGAVYWLPRSANIFNALSLICFAYLCHMNMFPVYKELRPEAAPADPRHPKRRAMFTVGNTSMVICFTIYALAGLFGYLLFLEGTEADLLKNFYVKGTSISAGMDVVRVGFGFAIIFSYPVVVWEARHGLELQLFGHGAPFVMRRFVLLNVCIVGGTLIVGMFLPTIGIPLGLIGSTCSPLIVFILPTLIFLAMDRNGQLKDDGSVTDAVRRQAKIVLGLG
eukprot:g6439.t1